MGTTITTEDIKKLIQDFISRDEYRVFGYSVSSTIPENLPLFSKKEYDHMTMQRQMMKINLKYWR